MGITKFSYDTLVKHGAIKEGLKMLELGDQNLYFNPLYGQYAKPHFQSLGLEHVSFDFGAHEGGALSYDLSKPIEEPKYEKYFDVVTNFGTSEHVSKLYYCLKNVHEFCKGGGLMFHENPKTGNWKFHGHHFFTQEFYKGLADLCDYTILDLGEHPAMGNSIDGWNVYCVLEKKGGKGKKKLFPTEEEFNKLDFRSE